MVTPSELVIANRFSEALVVVLFIYHLIYNWLQGRERADTRSSLRQIETSLRGIANILYSISENLETKKALAEVLAVQKQLAAIYPELTQPSHANRMDTQQPTN